MSAIPGKPATPRQRLAEISNYFLPDNSAPSTAAQHRPSYRIGLLNHSDATLPHLGIAEALAATGLHTIVDAGDTALRVEFMAETRPRTSSGPVVIKPYDRRLPAGAGSHDLLLLAVAANNDGIRHAYSHIKQLKDDQSPLGIAITGTADEQTARRCFHAFARAARDFLARQVLSYGYLDPSLPASAAQLASLIQAEYSHWHQARAGAKPQEKNHAQHSQPEY